MTLSEFRQQFEAWWAETDAQEVAHKNSQGALLELMALYERLDKADRIMANQVLGEWITSDNNRKRFDALAVVDRYQIRSAVPQLRVLESTVATRLDNEASYELTKVRRILAHLLS